MMEEENYGFPVTAPDQIEAESFAIIDRECKAAGILVGEEVRPIVYRAIHATADLDYAKNLIFTKNAPRAGYEALLDGAIVVTDTNMALAGINKEKLRRLGGEARCFMADEEVKTKAKARGLTRAYVSMEEAASLANTDGRQLLFAIGNAPTALMALCDLMEQGFRPALIIGVPVGFVHVTEAKELLLRYGDRVPCIISRGRKGGSGVAAAIVNAMLYAL